jgi:hypothetical protein
MRPAVFYAWQSDRPRKTTRDLIRSCASAAISKLAATGPLTDALRLDHDTQSKSGTPPIAQTIFQKIRTAAVFIADVTFIDDIKNDKGRIQKRICNDNVMIELGYAAATIGWDRIILVMNEHYGSPSDLPFDLRNHRFPISYRLGPESEKNCSEQLTAQITMAIRDCISSQYTLVDDTLRRLSSYARTLMKKHGSHDTFWEESNGQAIMSRLDHAVFQLLSAGVIECIDAPNDSGLAYCWTYLGQQCCLKLGVSRLPISTASEPFHENVFVDNTMYDFLRIHDANNPHGTQEPIE